MFVYAVQWHSAPLPPHEDEDDLDWATWPGHDDYLDDGEAHAAAKEFDAAFDGAYVHRVVARQLEAPGVASTRGASVVATGSTSSGPATATPLAHPAGAARRG
jgi:hypothetical protein